MTEDVNRVTAVILAGGLATRMGGIDKGLLDYRGHKLIEHVMHRVAPQVDDIIISSNRNLRVYEGFGLAVVPDGEGEFRGPLGGLAAATGNIESSLILSVACDMPNLPADLVARLRAALGEHEVAVAATRDGTQNVIALYRSQVCKQLAAYLASGQRKVADWQADLSRVIVQFDDRAEFININTPQDLAG